MTTQPRTQDEIYESIKARTAGEVPSLTDWSDNSPQKILVNDGYANALKRLEHQALAVQLSGWIDYAGGSITQTKLETLDIDASTVDIELLEEFMEDSDLDELVAQNGVERDPGARAIGTVEFTVESETTIPEGTEIATEPDSNGEYLSFFTMDEVTASVSETEVTVNAQAETVGTEYNVGSNTVIYLPSPPTGVTAVTNNSAMTGGEDIESNDELRERAKKAPQQSSEGGTIEGIKGGIASEFDTIETSDIFIDEKPEGGDKQNSSYADVYVDGGTDSEVKSVLDDVRPAAINHFLERPPLYEISVEATLSTDGSINTDLVEDNVRDRISSLGLGNNVHRDNIIQVVMNSDENIMHIESLTVSIVGEEHEFTSGTNVYTLDKGGSMENDGITTVTGTLSNSEHEFVENTDYQEWNSSSGDTSTPHDSIDWSLAGDTPDDGTAFSVDYVISDDVNIADTEKATPGMITITEA